LSNFNKTGKSCKFLFTGQAFFNHDTTSKIEMPFSVCLAKTVKFSHLLRAFVFKMKNPFSLSNRSIPQMGNLSIINYSCAGGTP
jgi:hypothetical protein